MLVVMEHVGASPALVTAVEKRAAEGPIQLRVVVPNPAGAELHLRHPERHVKAAEAEVVLRSADLALEAAAQGPVLGSVSVRHDPMDAIEEVLFSEPVDELIVSVMPHGFTRWLHQDLAHRLQHFGLPVTEVVEHDS